MNEETKKYPEEQQKLKDYLENVTIEQILEKLKDNDGMTWWVDWQDQYQPPFKKIYSEEVQVLLDYITNLQQDRDDLDDYNRYLYNELTNLQQEQISKYQTLKDLQQEKDKYYQDSLILAIENDKLHQENERLKKTIEVNTECNKLVSSKKFKRTMNKDYKSRCEKANEWLIDRQVELMAIQPHNSYVIDGNKLRDLENILQNGSDSNE